MDILWGKSFLYYSPFLLLRTFFSRPIYTGDRGEVWSVQGEGTDVGEAPPLNTQPRHLLRFPRTSKRFLRKFQNKLTWRFKPAPPALAGLDSSEVPPPPLAHASCSRFSHNHWIDTILPDKCCYSENSWNFRAKLLFRCDLIDLNHCEVYKKIQIKNINNYVRFIDYLLSSRLTSE